MGGHAVTRTSRAEDSRETHESNEAPGASRVPWRLSRRTLTHLVGLVVVLLLAVASTLYHPPYVILRAGPAVDTLGSSSHGELVKVTGLTTYPTSGALDFTTVAQYGGPGFEIDVWDLLVASLDSDAQIVPRDELYPPDATRDQVKEMTTEQMAGSQHAAATVALRAIGKPERALVAQVAPDGPAAGILRAKDVIVSVAGTKITSAPQVSTLVQQAGDTVAMTVERDRKATELSVPTKVVQATGPTGQTQSRRMIGIALEAKFDDSIKVTIDAGDVGGPSAGMMFALAVYDKITPGAMTGGQKIAGTGTMAIDGTVGPIGGITHKMVGAKEAGAGWFLAPAQDCAEVVGHVPDGLQVAKVATFDEARAAVKSIAAGTGASLPTCG